MALSTEELENRRQEMITQFEKYQTQVSDALNGVSQALTLGQYAMACSIMSTVSAHQAQASVRMRAVLVKNGFIVRERNDV